MTITTRRLLIILNFVEAAMDKTLDQSSSANRAKVAKTQTRIVRWTVASRAAVTEHCGEPRSMLPEPYFPRTLKTETTVINAALALVEDVYFLMRTRQITYSKEMKSTWNRLRSALVSMLELYDVDWVDDAGQVSGLALARRTWNDANRRRV